MKSAVQLGGDLVDRNAGGVGADDAAGLAHGIQPRHQRLFRREAFDDDLDDPVAVSQQLKIVLGIADRNQFGAIGAGQVGRTRLDHALVERLHELVALARVLLLGVAQPRRDNVQQHHRNADVGQVRGNAAPHGSGANDADFFYAIAHGNLLVATTRARRRWQQRCPGMVFFRKRAQVSE